jgi:DNA-binding HxlR family transcriptional regulator
VRSASDPREPPASGAVSDAPPLARGEDPSDEAELRALSDALAAVGDRWSLLVTAVLLDGPSRFGELQERIAGIAPNVLSQRLRRLEEQGLVLAHPYSERPPRYLYELTGAGRELAGPLRLLSGWGARRNDADDSGAPRHDACGSPLEARWYCPTCQEAVGQAGDEGPAAGAYYA